MTPTYKTMCLHGSEYWTYFLPRRVGPAMAHRLVKSDITISAEHAQHIGLVDDLIGRYLRTQFCSHLFYILIENGFEDHSSEPLSTDGMVCLFHFTKKPLRGEVKNQRIYLFYFEFPISRHVTFIRS